MSTTLPVVLILFLRRSLSLSQLYQEFNWDAVPIKPLDRIARYFYPVLILSVGRPEGKDFSIRSILIELSVILWSTFCRSILRTSGASSPFYLLVLFPGRPIGEFVCLSGYNFGSGGGLITFCKGDNLIVMAGAVRLVEISLPYFCLINFDT